MKITVEKMLTGLFVAVLASFSLVVSDEVDNNSEQDAHVEELFNRRIEAPNKTYILDSIFKGYDKRVRPYYREKPVRVSLYAAIDSFHDIKEEQMEYKVEIVMKEYWTDPRLAYGNATWFVRLKGYTLAKIWYPDTMIENSRKHEVDDKTRTAYLFGDGTVVMSEWIKATLSSHMDFQHYPMDVQMLKIQIAAYSYDDSQVLYRWSKVTLKEKDMTEFHVEKQTLRLETTSFITGNHTAAVAEFEVRRRLQHFIVEFYLPCIACTFASWIQFWMEVTAVGDRASLGITTVLTEIFLLQFSSQGMPKVSYMKAAELFVVVSFGFIFMALLESALAYKASFVILKQNKQDTRKKDHDDKIFKRKLFGVKKEHFPRCLVSRFATTSAKVDQSPRSIIGKEYSNGGQATVAKSPRLSQASNNDSLTCMERMNQSSEYILQDIPESEVNGPPYDPSSPIDTDDTRNLGLVIDQVARVLFPLMYIVFTIAYFVVI